MRARVCPIIFSEFLSHVFSEEALKNSDWKKVMAINGLREKKNVFELKTAFKLDWIRRN